MNIDNLSIKWVFLLVIVSLFLFGWFSNSLYTTLMYEFPFSNSVDDIASPYDHIKKEQIHVYDDRIVIDLKGATWAEFADTNSMDPIIDKDANSFEIKPESPSDVYVGDIISYKSEYAMGIIVHRVVAIGEDENGIFYKVKGDNLSEVDPGKIRFDQIHGVLVGVIY